MFRKFFAVAVVTVLALGFAVFSFAEEAAATGEGPSVSVGGHIKMTLFDRPSSIVRNNGTQTAIEKSYGFGFKELDLFISGKINNWISFEVDPKFSCSTGATPKFGVTQTATAGSAYVFKDFGHGKAVVIFDLPYDVTMEVGQVHPKFTAEYGHELFWEEQFNGGLFALGIGAVHDSGIEVSKAFSIGDVTLPVYAYVVNGGTEDGAFDINNEPGVMLHVEPVWNGLTVLGSIYSARTGAKEKLANTKWSAGFMYSIGDFSIRSEYAAGKQEQLISASQDGISDTYYVKAMYKVLPWLKLFAAHDWKYDNFTKTTAMPVMGVQTTAGAVISLADATYLQFATDVVDIRNNSGTSTLVYTRPSLGVRVTF